MPPAYLPPGFLPPAYFPAAYFPGDAADTPPPPARTPRRVIATPSVAGGRPDPALTYLEDA